MRGLVDVKQQLLHVRQILINRAAVIHASRRCASACARRASGNDDEASSSDRSSDDDDDDVSLEELQRAAQLARIDMTICSESRTSDGVSSITRSSSRETELLEQVRASLKSFSRVRSVDVGDAEPLYNMADFLRQYRQSKGIDDDSCDTAVDAVSHEDEMPARPMDNEELLSLSNSSIRDGQYLVPTTTTTTTTTTS